MKRVHALIAVLLVASCAQPAPDVASTVQVTYKHVAAAKTAAAAPSTRVVAKFKADGFAATATDDTGSATPTAGGTVRYETDSAEASAALLAKLQADPTVEFASIDHRVHITGTLTDPLVKQQWDLTPIQLANARDLSTGSGVTIGSVDTGVNYNHPDLAGQVVKGWNYVSGTADPLDDNGHGTHTIGTMAALTNNGAGIAGIAAGAKVLVVKALDASGSGYDSDIASGITYAAQHGAKVINVSLGGPDDDTVLHGAIQQATAAGALVVAAAGNDGVSTPEYPGAYSEVLSVGATDKNDARASFSNYGSWVGIAAPGASIMSTYENSYATMDGTSMAAPHVTAVAALLFAKHPDWSPAQVKAALISSGDACTGFSGNSAIRRLNAYKALQVAGVAATAAPTAAPTAQPTTAATATPTPYPADWWDVPYPSASPTTAAPTPTPWPMPYASAAPTATPVPATAKPTLAPGVPTPPVAPPPGPVTRATVAPTGGALAVSNVLTAAISGTSVTFTWNTNAPTNAQVELVDVPWTSPVTSSYVSFHAITVSGFTPGKSYRFRVHSTDASTRTAQSVVQTVTTTN